MAPTAPMTLKALTAQMTLKALKALRALYLTRPSLAPWKKRKLAAGGATAKPWKRVAGRHGSGQDSGPARVVVLAAPQAQMAHCSCPLHRQVWRGALQKTTVAAPPCGQGLVHPLLPLPPCSRRDQGGHRRTQIPGLPMDLLDPLGPLQKLHLLLTSAKGRRGMEGRQRVQGQQGRSCHWMHQARQRQRRASRQVPEAHPQALPAPSALSALSAQRAPSPRPRAHWARLAHWERWARWGEVHRLGPEDRHRRGHEGRHRLGHEGRCWLVREDRRPGRGNQRLASRHQPRRQ